MHPIELYPANFILLTLPILIMSLTRGTNYEDSFMQLSLTLYYSSKSTSITYHPRPSNCYLPWACNSLFLTGVNKGVKRCKTNIELFVFGSDKCNSYLTVLLSHCTRWRGWLGTSLQARRSRVRLPMVSLEIFIDVILPVVLWLSGSLSL